MSRLVEPTLSTTGFFRKKTAPSEYAERITKYIPGEVLSAYVAMNGILASGTEKEGGLHQWAHILIFLLYTILTPLYFRHLAKPGQPVRMQMVLSTVAFVIWAYNIGGIFKVIYPEYVSVRVHIPWIGSILIIAFTLVSGLFAPRAGEK